MSSLLFITGAITEPAGDTTLALIEAALSDGHLLDICDAGDLGAAGRTVLAYARRVTGADRHERPWLQAGPARPQDVAGYDAVVYRRDPPFGLQELHATLLLEGVRGRVRFLTDPRGLREANEKLYALRFGAFIPATAIVREPRAILAFATANGGDVVVKPLDGCGGTGVFRLRLEDDNARVIAETATGEGCRAVVVQRYLPAAATGDKRIILLDGRVVGSFLRVPRAGEHRCNLHRGATAVATVLTPRERELAAVVGDSCRSDGLGLVGLDVIGEHLTEVNVTSPTGLRELAALGLPSLPAQVIRGLLPAVRRPGLLRAA
jgi:glutathione synthase